MTKNKKMGGKPPIDLGIYIGHSPHPRFGAKLSESNMMAIGFAVFEAGPALTKQSTGTIDVSGVKTLEEKAMVALDFFKSKSKSRHDVIELTRYTLVTFGGSRAAQEGMSYIDHNRLIDITQKLFEQNGIKVTIKIYDGSND